MFLDALLIWAGCLLVSLAVPMGQAERVTFGSCSGLVDFRCCLPMFTGYVDDLCAALDFSWQYRLVDF